MSDLSTPTWYGTEKCITICDSHKVKYSFQMESALEGIKERVKYCGDSYAVFLNRSISSMVREWETHNLLYRLGLVKKHTKSVDLEVNQSWWLSALYRVGSFIYRVSL